MQLDMHYYGTYAMARAAGLNKHACSVIATAAQFVDDNAHKESVIFRDGGRLDAEATAHHIFDHKNIDMEDQRKIWVPFHFLPGNEGESFTEHLVCRMNSEVMKKMLAFTLSRMDQEYALELAGLTAHVYADTFSHYGFSGVSSRKNKIVNDSIRFEEPLESEIQKYVLEKAKRFNENYPGEQGLLTNIKSWFAETFSGALGHGAVATFPDRPYLAWSFKYEETDERCPVRRNQETFLLACESLHTFFREISVSLPDHSENEAAIDFASIRDKIKAILKIQAPKQGRIDAWQAAAKDGALFGSGPEDIPDYDGDRWHNDRDNLRRRKDSSSALNLHVYRFYQASSVYRTHLLRHLLPSEGLIVS